MGELLAKFGAVFTKGVKAVATGKTQANLGMQSPHLPAAAVRLGRFSYSSLATWILVSWYSAYVNQRVPLTESWLTKFTLPGGADPVISPPDRPNKSLPSILSGGGGGSGPLGPAGGLAEDLLETGAKVFGVSNVGTIPAKGRTLVPIAPSQLGVPGTAISGFLWTAPNGQKQKPPYNAARYRNLLTLASTVAKQYGLKITSSYRAGDTGLHGSGLAFDMVGRTTDMKRAAVWAAKSPGLFQEIFIHNEGSGMHLHIAFYPDAYEIFTNNASRYNRSSPRVAPNPTVPQRAIPT